MIPATVCFRPITPRTLRHGASSLVLAAVVLTTAPAQRTTSTPPCSNTPRR